MHQLQQGIHPNRTEGSPRHLSIECLAVWASPHYGTAILHHHRPTKPLLSESQGPLLALMTGFMMHTVKCQAALTHRNHKGQNSVSPFGVVFMYMRPLLRTRLLQIWKNILPCSISASAPRHSLRRVSHRGSGVSFLRLSHLRHTARAVSASWASPQSMMCIGSSFTA